MSEDVGGSRASALLSGAGRGKTTVGWAQPGGHGPKREPAIVWADPSTLTIVREGGKRIIVELEPGSSSLLAGKLGGASWVDAGDELPDEGMIVIVYVPDESEPVWLAYMDEDTEWRYVSGGRCHPTHWMDLPALPVAVSSNG